MITECSDMGTGALKTVTKKLHDVVEAIPDTGNLSSDYLGPLQSLESSFVHGLAVVRHLVNAARPVNRLPPEILAEIFSLVTECAALERIGGPSKWQLDLIQIRRLHALPTVCRYWHDVALGTRSLWPIVWSAPNTIPKYRGGIIQDQFALMHSPYPLTADYSGPLSVYFSDSYPRKAKELLEKYAIRTRELYLIMGEVTKTEDVSALLDTLETIPGDALEHFAMKLVVETVPLRKLSFFSGRAPKLRSLGIHMAKLYPTNTFPALTHLVVSYTCWTLDTLLDLLSRCPRLEHAHLIWLPTTATQRDFGVHVEGHPPLPEQRVNLRHMRRFTFSFTAIERVLAPAIEMVLSRVVLPPSCHLYLAPHVQAGSLTAPIGARFMHSVLRHWPVPVPATPASEHGIPRVRLDFDIDAELQLAYPHGSVSLTLRSRQVRAAAIAQEMVRAASESAVPPFTQGTKELWIRAQLMRGSADLEGATTLLRALPSLERLVVAGNPAAILQALVSRADGDGAALFCEELDTLSVFVYSRGDGAAVREVLAARARMGCPIRCLVVPGPLPDAKDPVTDADVRALGAQVEELVVVETKGWERVEVDWWTGRLREGCAGNAALARSLHCEWPTWEYLGWK